MIRIRLITGEKTRQKFVLDGLSEYIPRLKDLAKFEIIELKSPKSVSLSSGRKQAAISAAALKALRPREFLVVLDERGKMLTSVEFAAVLAKQMARGFSNFAVAIGGPFGWDASFRKRADLVLSFSKMTFSYQVTTLVVIEQLYRALSILKGAPYHK